MSATSTPVPPTPSASQAAHSPRGAARPVSTEQVRLVIASWTLTRTAAGAFADAFYAHLFALEPSLRLLFLGTGVEQVRERGERLADAFDVAVANLHRLETRPPRHDTNGHATPGDVIGRALFAALEHVLGPAFTAGVRDAWAAAYRVIAGAVGVTSSGAGAYSAAA